MKKDQNIYYRAHPWHGVDIGDEAPHILHCYIEIVPTDTVKFELDKESGLLKVDRPQKYSNYCPALYGLIPRTYSHKHVGDYCGKKLNRDDIVGDGDPIDICVITEKPFLRGDILINALPIGGIRVLDGHEADDKIIAILKDDLAFKGIKDIHECPLTIIDRLKHYFLTYKDFPEGSEQPRRIHIAGIYGREEAHEIIRLGQLDYQENF